MLKDYEAVSDLDLDKNVIGLIPAVENMPSGGPIDQAT